MANFVNFQFSAGEDYDQPFTIYDATGVNVQNITGMTIQLFVQKYADPTGTTWPFILTYPAALTDPTHGLCTVTFVSADTLPLPPRAYWYYLDRTDAGFEAHLAEGYLYLLP